MTVKVFLTAPGTPESDENRKSETTCLKSDSYIVEHLILSFRHFRLCGNDKQPRFHVLTPFLSRDRAPGYSSVHRGAH